MASIFNEMLNSGLERSARPICRFRNGSKCLSRPQVERALKEAEGIFRRLGITFAVYGSDEGTERLIPFDIIPRIFRRSSGAG